MGCPGGARCRALVGGPGHGLLVPCEEQPLAPGPQTGLPLCCRLPPLPAATTSPSPLRGRRLPACPPARCPPALGPGAGGEEMREGGWEEGRQEGGRQAERGGRGFGGGGACIGRGWGPARRMLMRGRRCIGWRAHPRATPSTTRCHRPAQAALGHRSRGDERQEDLRRPCCWWERATKMKKYAEEQ